jgi:anti-sigma regulatory factor (Ser/Thr protein kinase)
MSLALRNVRFPIDDPSRTAEVRRFAGRMARSEGLADGACANAEVVATEIATNLLKHASQGEIHITGLSQGGRAGIELLSIDHGPGMSSIDHCIRDGFSSAGSPGTGLGAITRLSDDVDAYSVPGKGTVLVSRIWADSEAPISGLSLGWVSVPIRGEDISGDNWAIHTEDTTISLIVADGLGHGILAAEASQAAVDAFRTYPTSGPAVALDQVHRRLRGTRGAAVAIAALNVSGGTVKYAGIGNICGVIAGGTRTQSMVSHNGTAGHEARKLQEFSYALPPHWTVIMHSDGINTSWNLDRYPGLVNLHPSVIAGVLYRDGSRHRDDVCMVVLKNQSLL